MFFKTPFHPYYNEYYQVYVKSQLYNVEVEVGGPVSRPCLYVLRRIIYAVSKLPYSQARKRRIPSCTSRYCLSVGVIFVFINLYGMPIII